jgi:hypothetical protein
VFASSHSHPTTISSPCFSARVTKIPKCVYASASSTRSSSRVFPSPYRSPSHVHSHSYFPGLHSPHPHSYRYTRAPLHSVNNHFAPSSTSLSRLSHPAAGPPFTPPASPIRPPTPPGRKIHVTCGITHGRGEEHGAEESVRLCVRWRQGGGPAGESDTVISEGGKTGEHGGCKRKGRCRDERRRAA